MIDRSEAVNLARNFRRGDALVLTDKGIECLIKAVLDMDRELSAQPEAGVIDAAMKVIKYSAPSRAVDGTYIVNDDAMRELAEALKVHFTPAPQSGSPSNNG